MIKIEQISAEVAENLFIDLSLQIKEKKNTEKLKKKLVKFRGKHRKQLERKLKKLCKKFEYDTHYQIVGVWNKKD